MAKTKSPKYSLKGWELKKWIVGNSSTIKEILKVGVPYLASTYFTSNMAYNVAITGLGKLALDAIEYWSKDYK